MTNVSTTPAGVDPVALAKSGPVGPALLEIGERRADVVALSADVAGVTGLTPFSQAFPDRFVNVGMAEENLIAVAVGLSKAGFTPVATTFAVFASRRALDLIAIQCALNRANVKIVAALPGIYSTFGPTHQGIDDLAHMRALPNMTVIDPCDNAEMAEALAATVELEGPVYLRQLLGRETADVDRAGHAFRIGPAQLIRDGGDVGIVTSGIMVRRSLDAARALADRGIEAAVLKVSTLKPFDGEAVLELARGVGSLVTAENHSVIGGLFSAVSEVLARAGTGVPVRPVGVRDEFCSFGSNAYVAERHGLTADAVVNAVEDAIRTRG
ncbi:MAG: transketolase C-terminal domain-containing protein [Actinomycetota bacterium]